MEDHKEKNAPWMSVPQFGDWDQKGQLPDYSMDFSKIRENRKQNKRDVSRASLGNEEELISKSTASSTVKTTAHSNGHRHHYDQDRSPTKRDTFKDRQKRKSRHFMRRRECHLISKRLGGVF